MCDEHGFPVANTVILAKAHQQLFDQFVLDSIPRKHEKVLDSFGTRALTRFIRKLDPDTNGKGILIIPPHYFLWEPYKHGEERLPHTISHHYYQTTWGDNRLRTRVKKRLGFRVKPWEV